MGGLLFLCLLLSSLFSSSTPFSLSKGSSLSVEKADDILISPNGVFSAGFYRIGENAYGFAVWFSEPLIDGNHTIVWMANRDQPVNGRLSKLSALNNGDLVLTDAGQFTVWATGTNSNSTVQLQLHDTGNLVLLTSEGGILWQSFDSPTDTLLPHQPLTRYTKLVSSRSQTNYSSGFYKLYFDDDNVLRLVFDGLEVSSVYWPDPWLNSWEAQRSSYITNRTAELDSSGHFKSTDDFQFSATDFGIGPQRRLTMDVDGNVRLYSLDEERRTWVVTWQAFSHPCRIHGICGSNSMCTYAPHEKSGRKCSCIPGYKLKNHTDWSYGCEPDFHLPCNDSQTGFIQLPHVELYGHDSGFFTDYTLEMCEEKCLKHCNCKGFQYKFDLRFCYIKALLRNGYLSPSFPYPVYIKLPKATLSMYEKPKQEFMLGCSGEVNAQLPRTYKKPHENGTLKFILWFAGAFGGVEFMCICFVWCFLYKTHQRSGATTQGYLQVATKFKRFSYTELKKASSNFSVEIGRGGGGIVYKGVLPDKQVVAIKRLNEATQGEAEFLAELSTIGRLNHMNLIETWGYCAEGKHRLLVYEYMEHGSLAENLHDSNTLDWEKRFNIAVGTAKCLAYLHEECLEWVLHCDVKPHNILLDSNYQPKVADFGLSKLLNRGGDNNSSFSRIRGTRGYMAPEWVFNHPITSKVDVYSYGVVVLEIVTGKSPTTGVNTISDGREMEQRRLVEWVREKMNESATMASWIEEIIDPMMNGEYDIGKLEILVGVALQCVEEDKDARPTMSQVVEMLLLHQDHY
uniref:Receptor-like serine/threonine-protein kinase n=1 Tax=Davidia involucrata TaxID=16924 RepID=A0A5B6YV09_DAVIN